MLDWVTLGVQVLIMLGIIVGATYNAKNFKYCGEALASHRVMIALLQTEVHMLKRIVQQAGLVNFGLEDDGAKAEDLG